MNFTCGNGETDADGLHPGMRTLVTTATPTPQPTSTPTAIPFVGLDVQVVSITTLPGQVTVRLRLYNGGGAPLTIAPDDVWLALGYAENPPGPRVPAEGMLPFDLLPGQAADMTLTWLWQGEPYGSFGVGGWRWSIELGLSSTRWESLRPFVKIIPQAWQ